MEDLLDLYAEPYDPRRPVVCFDERPLRPGHLCRPGPETGLLPEGGRPQPPGL